MSLLTIHTIKLSTFRAPRSLQPFTSEAAALAGGPCLCIEIGQGSARFVMPRAQLDRADSYAVDRVTRAGIEATANWRHDQVALGRVGFSQAWVDDHRFNLEQLTALDEEQRRRAHAVELDGAFTDGLEKEAAAIVRSVLFLAQGKKVRHLFQIEAADWQSKLAIGGAIFELVSKIVDPRIQPTLHDIGVDDGVVRRLGEIRVELARRSIARKDAEVDALRTPEQVRAAKALILSDLQLLSNAARAILPDEGWSDRYQLGRLLGETSRAPAPVPTPTPTPTPAPVSVITAPTPAAGTTPGGTTTSGTSTPGTTAGAATPGGTATGTTTPGATGFTGTATGLSQALGALTPGTIITIHGPAGPSALVVQADGSLAPAALLPPVTDEPTPRRGARKTKGATKDTPAAGATPGRRKGRR